MLDLPQRALPAPVLILQQDPKPQLCLCQLLWKRIAAQASANAQMIQGRIPGRSQDTGEEDITRNAILVERPRAHEDKGKRDCNDSRVSNPEVLLVVYKRHHVARFDTLDVLGRGDDERGFVEQGDEYVFEEGLYFFAKVDERIRGTATYEARLGNVRVCDEKVLFLDAAAEELAEERAQGVVCGC